MGLFEVFKESFREFSRDRAPRLAAALAYYSLFSIAPLLVIAVAIAGFAFGEEAARGQIVEEIRGVVGEVGGQAIQQMVADAGREKEQGTFATIAGFAALLFGASGVFSQLKDTLNAIWGVEVPKRAGIVGHLRKRLLSFAMVLTVGFLLLISLVLSAALAAAGEWMPGGVILAQFLNAAVSLAVITLLFALIYKYVPDARIRWSDVWVGALFTSFLFVIGKFGIGFYLGRSSVASSYGAAASIIIVILWLYYSGLILFFGAEFTEVYAREHAGLNHRSERKDAAQSDGGEPTGGVQPVDRRPRGRSGGPERSRATIAKKKRRGRGIGAPVAAALAGAVLGGLVGVLGAVIAAVKLTGRIFR